MKQRQSRAIVFFISTPLLTGYNIYPPMRIVFLMNKWSSGTEKATPGAGACRSRLLR
jgi:hypothetical protein